MMKAHMGFLAAGAALAASVASPSAAATLITPKTAIASSVYSPGTNFDADNTIDGSGLSGSGATEDQLHAIYNVSIADSWVTAENPEEKTITWGFENPFDLAGVYIWNHYSYFVKKVSLDWFGEANGSKTDVALSATNPIGSTFGSEFVPFSAKGVTTVRLTIKEGSATFGGLSEVRFLQADPTTVIPVPAALPLLASAFGLLAIVRRRRGA